MLFLALILISSCASTSETYAPDGSKAHAINCSGTARNWGMCYETAGNICGAKGYEVLSKSENPDSAIIVGRGGVYEAFASSKFQRSMVITCGEVPQHGGIPAVQKSDVE